MCKVPAAFIVLIVASMQVGCANLHLFGMVGSNPQNPLRSGDAEMRRLKSFFKHVEIKVFYYLK